MHMHVNKPKARTVSRVATEMAGKKQSATLRYYAKITEVNLSAFAYRLSHEDFMKISRQSSEQNILYFWRKSDMQNS